MPDNHFGLVDGGRMSLRTRLEPLGAGDHWAASRYHARVVGAAGDGRTPDGLAGGGRGRTLGGPAPLHTLTDVTVVRSPTARTR
ncbi:hypothetical protein [Streptomyces sp. XD-27]|uniref:hypothetical protein n=1 Tax=Streptomyces sp. XD-27 TaxID=3062779 RepID=UPI0026F42401|nr:hypothetical protein [Streptomyces sp. XD-27]WKX68688.1 hypothetical protein Q3Y56_00915 [Streptomyces sp. XD-27]